MTTKQALELYQRAGATPPPDIAAPSAEYIRNTRRKVVDGIAFRSTLEANAYQIIRSWQDAGIIWNLMLQPVYILQDGFTDQDGNTIRPMRYTADFRFDRKGITGFAETVVIETKGHRTEPYRMRRKMFLKRYPYIRFEEWDREKVNELTQ